MEAQKSNIQKADTETSQTSQKLNELELEQVGLIYQQSFYTLFGTIGILLFFAYVLKSQNNPLVVTLWLSSAIFIYVLRIALSHTYLRLPAARRSKQLTFWKKSFLLGSLLAGSAWGTGSILLMPAAPLYQAFIVVVIGGGAAVAAMTHSAIRYAGMLFILPALLPLCIYYLLTGGMVYAGIGVLILIFIFLISTASYYLNKMVRQNFEIAYQNRQLIGELRKSNAEALRLNMEMKKENIERRNAEERFRRLSDASNEGIIIQDQGTIVDVNRNLANLLGYEVYELMGMDSLQIIAEESRELLRQNFFVPDGKSYQVMVRCKCGDRIPVVLRCKDFPLGDMYLQVVTIQDLSERLAVESALSNEKERALVTLESIGDSVITTNADGIINYINPVTEHLSGWDKQDAAGKYLADIIKLTDQYTGEVVTDPVANCLMSEASVNVAGEIVLQGTRSTQKYSIEATVSPIRDKQQNIIGTVLVFHDVTVLQTMAQQMSHQATHDALTGLFNRQEFENRLVSLLETVRKTGQQHAMLYLDLDAFKVVNDTSGHAAGDQMIQEISSKLEDCIRDMDTLARLGGDEFGIILTGCPIKRAKKIADEICETIKNYRMVWDDHVHGVGVSIGLIPLNAESGEISDILRDADSACYIAKDQGRNRVHVYKKNDAELARHHGTMRWMQRIRRALQDDTFQLYYQPIRDVALSDFSTWHAELLIRMVNERGDIIEPKHFVPAAERYHLMVDIDQWVIRHTLEILPRLVEYVAPKRLICAINLSGQSLSDDHFLEFLVNELDKLDLEPVNLCFEITETAAIANFDHAQRFISTMHGMGCTFALDDFGSGLSSFAYLKHLSVDYLKIDGSFVRNISHDDTDYAMVNSIQQIGNVMGIKTIAEFVESPEIVQRLQTLGVDYMQGREIGEPLPLDDLLNAGHPELNKARNAP